ncbi:NUDIX domain-containing protein [Glutamicibacter sp. MNS18]|uniref:NUDIX hydrolase n=1 Tax=Glutamicibacter sp. MNS18 TaxID=2989817 RepID=UPI0022356203|nr:NUDIX domain-containing protein [Glutamicibacter sp. MNS18]MCW4464255.1 NUDIX domain-containing protein [Glutamicibacter sp. MNS18]
MTVGPERRLVRKVVGYVVRGGRLLVFTHDGVPLEVAGVQVPAGSIEPGEQPVAAVVREVREETGVDAQVVRVLGVERYDVWPAKPELHERHFFQLAPLGGRSEERWRAGEEMPSDDGPTQRWTCQWIPLEQAHVLCAGFGARLGEILLEGDSGAAAAEG